MSLRVASLDYLGVVAARLRKDAVTSQNQRNHVDTIIREIKAEEMKDESESNKSSKKVSIESAFGHESQETRAVRTSLVSNMKINYLKSCWLGLAKCRGLGSAVARLGDHEVNLGLVRCSSLLSRSARLGKGSCNKGEKFHVSNV